jgi:hypothetical protein
MTPLSKQAERERKARTFRDLVRSFANICDVYSPTPASIFDCVTKAHTSEKEAISSGLSREELFREDPRADVPDELTDSAIAQHLTTAGSLFATAGGDCVAASDLPRAFKYFRRAVKNCISAAALNPACRDQLLGKAREYREKTAIIRLELARRCILRRHWSLGFLKRRR